MSTPSVGFYWGDDTFGLDRAAAALGERLVASTGGTIERWRVSGSETSIEQIAERVATAPLFGGGTLVIVQEPAPLARSRPERERLIALIGQVAPGNALALVETVDASGRRSSTLDPVRTAVQEAGGEAREIRAPREGQMAAWIQGRADEQGIRLARGTARALAERIGAFVREGDVDRRRMGVLAATELDKLALYRPDTEITPEDVEALVPEAIPASLWAFTDAVGRRRAGPASTLLMQLLDATPEPVMVAILHRRLRELIEMADRLGAGETLPSIARAMKLKPYRAERLADQARSWTVGELISALDGLLDLDARVKGIGGASEGQRRLSWSLWIRDAVAPR
jgi:DNA polymerase III delta subunit